MPCGGSNLALPATYDRCQVLLAFHIDDGEVDGVDVGDTSVAMLADTPAQMTDGNWRVGLIIDERADEEQRAKLTSVFAGEQGGPAGMFAPLVGEMLGVEVAPIEFADDGLHHTLRIGDGIELDIQDFESIEEGRPMALEPVGHPAGPAAQPRAGPARGDQRLRDGDRQHRAQRPLRAVRVAGVTVARRDGARPALAAAGCSRPELVAWLVTLDRMAGMDAGPGTDLGALGWFLGLWATMMAAMMLPATAPVVTLTRARRPRRRAPRSSPATWLVWIAFGLAAFALYRVVAALDPRSWRGSARARTSREGRSSPPASTSSRRSRRSA